jgi:glycosyltransferase involved in cell wall biosynthesis
MKISILIPVYNEKKTIISLLEKVNIQKNNIDLEIIVSDDGSKDGTLEMLKENNHLYDKLITNGINSGKGTAIIKALEFCNGEYTLIQDADLEYDPEDYKKLLLPANNNRADAVYGSRFMGDEPRRILYFSHRVANFIITTLVNTLTNINFTDVETCYKLIKTDILKSINLKEKSFGFEIETTMKLAKKKVKFFEVGIRYYGRTYEEGKKIQMKDGIIAIYKIFYYRLFN